MDFAGIAQAVFMTLYTFVLVMVSVYGLHRYALVFLYYRHRRKRPAPPAYFEDLPFVTIQLPMYNERLVARRIIEKTTEIDYPSDRLQIQVLDDSIDDTARIARQAVDDARAKGFNIEYIHRDNRKGYKAGALANGLKTATGEFVTIFDADFVPEADFLKRSIHYFTDPKVCVVQTRWDHINRNDSLLTRTQAIFLDGHFAIEHVARNRSERFMSFNGTAGTWRRAAILDAGGWHHDTLTEDLDLSYRAQLKGWKFIFLPELIAPAELPPEMIAFKAQQFRWTKGGAQTALKMLPKVMLSKAPLKVKVEAFFHLTCFTMHFYVLMLMLMLFPAMWLKGVPVEEGTMWRGLFDLSIFTLATLSASVFYIASQVELFRNWRSVVKFLPVLMALGVGLCISNTQAILEALFGKKSEFVRTPKYGGKALANRTCTAAPGRKPRRKFLPYVELLFGIYLGVCTACSLMSLRGTLAAPFLVIFMFGFFYVSVLSFQVERSQRFAAEAPKDLEAVRG
ncbi:MAG: cellulose synthase family protein [Planctomycetota bacterium]|jgi:cellulose synthase/poly-beta-1,6-N-acetylglucosamine synthase-like glycosyltransferase